MVLEWTRKQLENAGFTNVQFRPHKDRFVLHLTPPCGDVDLLNPALIDAGGMTEHELERLAHKCYGAYASILFGRVEPLVD